MFEMFGLDLLYLLLRFSYPAPGSQTAAGGGALFCRCCQATPLTLVWASSLTSTQKEVGCRGSQTSRRQQPTLSAASGPSGPSGGLKVLIRPLQSTVVVCVFSINNSVTRRINSDVVLLHGLFRTCSSDRPDLTGF